LWLLKYLPNMPASHVAILHDLRGPNNSITHREVSGGLAIGEATAIIRRGAADAMVVGATGSSLGILRAIQTSFLGEIVQDEDLDPAAACRPFDLHRRGMVPGEGSAVLVLETEAGARSRGAHLYGEVLGHGSSCAIVQRVADVGTALGHAIRAAMSVAPGNVKPGHIHAHGLGTHEGDRQEAHAIASAMEGRLSQVPVVAAKAYFGNLGAAGELVELVISLLALREGILFPNRNLQTLDVDCPLHVPRGRSEPAGASVLSVSYSPNGQASAVWIGSDAAFHR
jgi:3-oxoacyl-[acyl-carrier-protein] synthase II